jgi:hypothetical protein
MLGLFLTLENLYHHLKILRLNIIQQTTTSSSNNNNKKALQILDGIKRVVIIPTKERIL